MKKESNKNQELSESAIKALDILNPQIINGGYCSDEEDDEEFKEDNLEESSLGVTNSK